MAAVMRPQSFTQQYQYQYSPRTRPSILINTAVASGSGSSIAQKRISNSNTPSNQSLTSSLEESSSSSSSSNSKSKATGSVSASSSLPSRRIRFAPLPDPTLLEGEDGDGGTSEDPHPHAASLGASPAPPELLLPSAASSYYSPSGSAANSRQNSPLSQCRPLDADYIVVGGQNESTATLPDPFRAPDSHNGNPTANGLTPTPSHMSNATITAGWKPKRLLKPFMRRAPSPNPRSSPRAAPAASRFNLSSISAEDVLTLGTINLFRSGSRESRSGASTTSSEEDARAGAGMLSLGRWTSAGSAGGKGKGKEWFGSPLARSESAHSLKGDERRGGGRARASSVTSNSSSKSANAALGGAKGPGGARAKGTRMLNGRVYGGRRALKESNLFETAKDEEPAFVEWGYGGMGAVKSKGAHPDKDGVEASYSKVHGGTGLTATKGGDDDDDDGGGVSWARKRKEAREKAAKEKAAAEAAAAAAPTQPPAAAESAPTPAETANANEKAGAAAVELVSEPAEMTVEEAPKPLVHAFPGAAVAAASPISPASPVRPHHRTRSGSGSASLISLPSAPPPEERERGPRSPLRLASFEYKSQAPPAVTLKGEKSGSGSGTTSEDENDNENESDDDGASSEDEDEATIRKTALGAGVEKVSRHKDAEEAHAPPAHPHAHHE